MKLLRCAIIAVVVAITGCASTVGHHHRNLAGLDKQQKNIWERIRKEFDIPNLNNDPKVDYWTEFYASRPQMIRAMAERSRRYIYYITKELEKRDMPSELALLPFVESAYNAKALSRSKAAGLWQFIPSTGTHYNLVQDWWRDERQDTIHSTRAALDYLAYLYQFQGKDWHLALASYNWGEGAVRRARDRNAAQGLGTDFLSLRMPDETRNYVPKLLAIKRIIANPAKYGITLPHIPDQPYFVEVAKDDDMDVSTIVRLAGISDEEFRLLNPADKRPVILKAHKTRILLPKKNLAIYEENLKRYQGKLSSWAGYKPAPGESLASIAKRHGISLEKLKSLNGYTRKQKVAVSSRLLLVPRKPGLSIDASPSGINTKEIRNPVASSSTMLASNQVNLPVQTPALREVNPNVRLGQSATHTVQPRLVSASQSAKLSTQPESHLTAMGHDDLIGNLVSTQSTTTLSDDVRVSTVSTPKAGVHTATYIAHTKTKSVSARAVSAPKYTKRSSAGPQIHKVVTGDTLYSLARRYNTTVSSIRALNNLGKRNIRVGERLRMPGSGVRG